MKREKRGEIPFSDITEVYIGKISECTIIQKDITERPTDPLPPFAAMPIQRQPNKKKSKGEQQICQTDPKASIR